MLHRKCLPALVLTVFLWVAAVAAAAGRPELATVEGPPNAWLSAVGNSEE